MMIGIIIIIIVVVITIVINPSTHLSYPIRCRPDYYVDMEYIGGKRRMKKAGLEVKKAAIPDDIRVRGL